VWNATRWLVREMDQEHVVLSLQLGEHALPVLADRIQIEQVFVNILQNSIDAIRETGAPGRVDVRAGPSVAGMAEVMVYDTGGDWPPARSTCSSSRTSPRRQGNSEWVWRSAAPSSRRITRNLPGGPYRPDRRHSAGEIAAGPLGGAGGGK
jgi:hypothetical protein